MTSEELAIRDFRRGDEKEIVRLHLESSENFEEQEITEGFILTIANREDFRFFIMASEGRIIGFVGVLFHKNIGRAEIGPICVSPVYRGRGVGTRLLNHAIEFLGRQGLYRTIVRIKSDNRRAQRFFGKNGFEEEGYFQRYTRKGEDILQLRRFI
jgi:ribosomal protein S18 acetylase RimI-like enzyme